MFCTRERPDLCLRAIWTFSSCLLVVQYGTLWEQTLTTASDATLQQYRPLQVSFWQLVTGCFTPNFRPLYVWPHAGRRLEINNRTSHEAGLYEFFFTVRVHTRSVNYMRMSYYVDQSTHLSENHCLRACVCIGVVCFAGWRERSVVFRRGLAQSMFCQ